MEEGEKSRLSNQYSNSLIEKFPGYVISVLVVDDDTTCLAIVAAILKRWKYQVMTVKHPTDALCTLRLENLKFDVVLVDVHMPEMNGFELQQHIHQEFQLPVVLMSADDKDGILLEGIECGAEFFLQKPICVEDLRDLWQYVERWKKKSGGGQKVMADISSNEDRQGKRAFKRKSLRNVGARKNNNVDCTEKKEKADWAMDLHHRFVDAVESLGPERAIPRNILRVMNEPGLTREQVASHLQKYRMFLKEVDDAKSEFQFSSLDGRNNIQSSYVFRNPSAMKLNKLKHQKLWSTTFSNDDPFSMSTPPSGYGQPRLLSNTGISSGLITDANSMLMHPPPGQATQNFVSNGLSTYGSPTFGVVHLSGSVPAHETIGTSSVSHPVQNLSHVNSNFINDQIRAEKYCVGNEQQVDRTFGSMNNHSIFDSVFTHDQQPYEPSDLSRMFLSEISLESSTDQQHNEQQYPYPGTSIGSNHVGDTLVINRHSSEKFGGDEMNGSIFGSNGIQSDEQLLWFYQNPSQHFKDNGETSNFNNSQPAGSAPSAGDQWNDEEFLQSLLVSEPHGMDISMEDNFF